MTRTAIRCTLFALAAAALVSAFASSPASAQSDSQIDSMMNNNLQMLPAQRMAKGQSTGRLSTHNSRQPTTTTHYPIRWFQDYSGAK